MTRKYLKNIKNTQNLFNSPSPIDGEFDFDMEKAFKDNPTSASNTLYLGNSTGNLETSNSNLNSILNKNISNVNSSQNKNETLYEYSNNKQFFDNSIINNINSGITMTSLINCKEKGNTPLFLEGEIIQGGGDKGKSSEEKDPIKISVELKSSASPDAKQEIDFDNCNAQLKSEQPYANRKRSAYRFIEESLKEGGNSLIASSVRSTKDPIGNKETPVGSSLMTRYQYHDNNSPIAVAISFPEKKGMEYESRRKKNQNQNQNNIFNDIDKPGKCGEINNKNIDKDMIIGDSSNLNLNLNINLKKGYGHISGSGNTNSPNFLLSNSSNNHGSSNIFGIVESRRHNNIGAYNHFTNSKIAPGTSRKKNEK